MEYCGGGDLLTTIEKAVIENRHISEGAVWGYFVQILWALKYCHDTGRHGVTSMQIVHRDLKPANGKLWFLLRELAHTNK